jgi:hypothetical protein
LRGLAVARDPISKRRWVGKKVSVTVKLWEDLVQRLDQIASENSVPGGEELDRTWVVSQFLDWAEEAYTEQRRREAEDKTRTEAEKKSKR